MLGPLVLAALAATGPAARAGERAGAALLVKADQPTYAPGQPMTFTLEVVNRGAQPVRLRFPTAQRFDLVLQDAAGRDRWRWSADRMFAQELGEETVPAGRPGRTWRVTVRELLPPGPYTALAVVPAQNARLEATVAITVR